MKMTVEYLEHARRFEHLAGETVDPEVKARMLEQAEAYRKLADERAVRLRIATVQGREPGSYERRMIARIKAARS